MALYSLMHCDYCGREALSFCKGDRCGQNNDLNKFLCDECVRIHGQCRLCQVVIRVDVQTMPQRGPSGATKKGKVSKKDFKVCDNGLCIDDGHKENGFKS